MHDEAATPTAASSERYKASSDPTAQTNPDDPQTGAGVAAGVEADVDDDETPVVGAPVCAAAVAAALLDAAGVGNTDAANEDPPDMGRAPAHWGS